MINISGLNKLVECYGALTATNVTFTNKTDIETLQTKTQNIIRIPGTEEDPTSYTEIDGVSFQTTLERISNIEGTLTKVSYDPLELLTTISGKLTVNGNITASNLTGIAYNSNLQLQGTDYCSATILNRHIYIELTAMTYAPHLGMRIHKTNLSNGQELMLQVGKDSTRAISFVYKHYDTIANSQYRLDFAGRNAYICNYGAPKTEHEIRGNLNVYGSVTANASMTITHYTMYEGDLQPGFFVESTGQIFCNGETSYENCMVTIKQATTFSNNIIGVCTEIMNEEVTDDYGNVNQPAGKYCKFATHGDCLIKCESATYTCGDIIVPSTNGIGKKGSSTDVLNCMLSMTPRLKVTSVDTDEIDPQCVVGFITV